MGTNEEIDNGHDNLQRRKENALNKHSWLSPFIHLSNNWVSFAGEVCS